MACKVKLWFIFTTLIFALKLQLVFGEPKVPCVFIFGDSLNDNGNNNRLFTMAKSNYPPYGIDFKDGPTGRFSNGRNRIDFITQLLGFDNLISSVSTANRDDILIGVNYGSGSAGILPETGSKTGQVHSLPEQLRLHRKTISDINALNKNETSKTQDHLRKCLYIVGFGSNDYINNYLMPEVYRSSQEFTPEKYADLLIQKYTEGLESLYELGARKIAIFSLGDIGCVPFYIAKYVPGKGACAKNISDLVAKFDNKLKPLVEQLNAKHHDAHFTLLNMNSIMEGVPVASGVPNWFTPCCKASEVSGLCKHLEKPCMDRDKHGFYDMFHPTEIASEWTAKRAFNAHTPTDGYPQDISHLIQL